MILYNSDIFKNIVTVLLGVFVLVYVYYKWAFYYWRRRGVQCVPTSIPFGSVSSLIYWKTTFGELFRDVYLKYQAKGIRYVGFYVFAKPTLIITDMELIKAVLSTDFQHFTDTGYYVNEKGEPLTCHLFNLKGPQWKPLRAKLTPTFTSGKMKMMFHTITQCSGALRGVMDNIVNEQKPVEIKDVVTRYTTDVIGSCAFGLDSNSLNNPNSEFRQFGKQVFDDGLLELCVRLAALFSPKLVASLGLKFLSKQTTEFITRMVKETVDYREKHNIIRNDFMHLLIQLKNNVALEDTQTIKNVQETNVKDGLTMEQIGAQSLLFLVAGFETSSTTLTFCLYELASNPDIQSNLRSQIKSTLAKHDNNFSYEAVMDMSYMDKCIKETLRMYPPLPLILRECTKDYKIPNSDVVVEKGMRVFISILGIHHNPEYHRNPEKFDPERFNTKIVSDKNQYTWLPFGEGPRTCIAMRFGLMQTKVALATLIKDYEFTLNEKTETPLVMTPNTIVMTPRSGVWLHVKKAD